MAQESEMMAIIRRVPKETIAEHARGDQQFVDDLIRLWNTKPTPPKRDVVGSRISILLLVSFNKEFLGDRLLPHSVDAAVTSFADCFFVR